MLHAHVSLVAPLTTGNVLQSGTDQHESRVPIRETTDHSGPSTDLSVQSFKDVNTVYFLAEVTGQETALCQSVKIWFPISPDALTSQLEHSKMPYQFFCFGL